MKLGERIVVSGGWLSFGRELVLRADQVQSVSVEPAAAANVPEEAAHPGSWFQIEVKYAPRSAPYVVFVGSEKQCQVKVACVMAKLRASSDV